MQLSKISLDNYDSQIEEEINSFRSRGQRTLKKETYIENSIEQLKKQKKVLKKVKGSKITKKDLQHMARAQHQKESDICAAIATADHTLTRKLERTFTLSQKDEAVMDNNEFKTGMEAFVAENRTAERLVCEVMANEGRLWPKEELLSWAKEYIESDGLEVKTTLSTTSEEFIEKADTYIEKNQKQIFVWMLLGLTISNLVLLVIRYTMCIITLDRTVISTNPVYLFGSAIISVAAWVLMTTQDYFNFHNRKWRMLIVVCANISATFLQVVYTMAWDLLVVNIFLIKTNDLFTPSMVMTLARLAVSIALAIGIVVVIKIIKPFITVAEVKDRLLAFKLSHVVDNRENKEYKYDFTVVKDLLSGSVIPVRENDLFTHALIIGASGTGKTSSVYLPQIIVNIERKMKNLDLQQQATLKMLQTRDIEIIKPFHDGNFSKHNFRVLNKRRQKEFDDIFKKYEDCGITVVAPNNSLSEDLLTYASGRGIWVYNLDPTKKKATHPYERLVGMNPFFVPPRFHEIRVGDNDAEEERNIYIAEAANNFADALTAINEMNGSGDQYFTDVNTTVTNAVTTVLMLDASIRNIQITIEDVYNCIVDYNLLTPVVSNIKSHFNIKYQAEVEDRKKKRPTKGRNKTLTGLDNDDTPAASEDTQIHHMLAETDRKNPYLQTIITVESRLQKGSKMDEHAEGLRNLLGKLLQDPRVKRVLVTNKDIIDFNTILAENAITVVNTAIDIGKNTSTCFGQLFLLNFNTAVLRRPKDTRTPHFLYEDETARYLSDMIDTMVTLYRQFRVACMFALQSLEQVDGVKNLSYLKDVLLSAGTIITFGRASYTDAKQISDLSGQVKYLMAQNTASRTAITAENASSSFSVRTTPDQKNVLESNDIRARDFQECTIITTDNGRVMPGKLAKVNFVPREIISAVSRPQIERKEQWEKVWAAYFPLLEDALTVTAQNSTSTDAALNIAKELKSTSRMAPKNVEKMSEVLAGGGIRHMDVSNDEMLGQIDAQEGWDDEDFLMDDIEDDDDFKVVGEQDTGNGCVSATVYKEPAAKEEGSVQMTDAQLRIGGFGS